MTDHLHTTTQGCAPVQPDPMPACELRGAVNRFLEHCRISKGLSANTVRAYRTDLTDFLARFPEPTNLVAIDPDSIRTYVAHLVDDRHLRPTSVRRRIASLKVLVRWLEAGETITTNPFHRLNVSIRIPQRLPGALDQHDAYLLLRQSRREIRARASDDGALLHFILVLLFVTGLRVGELAGTQLEDVSLRDASIRVRGKGNRERKVYFSGHTAKAFVAAYLGRQKSQAPQALLVRGNGQSVSPAWIRRRLAALARRAGVERRVTPHMLRHTAATQLLEAGLDIRFVQRLLGHASITTTQLYAHVSDRALRARLSRADTLRLVQEVR